MALPEHTQPLIKQGWIRAVLLLVIYVSCSVAAGMLINSMETWVAVSFLVALVLVYFFRRYIDRKPFETLLGLRNIFPFSFWGLSLGIFLVCAATLSVFFLGGIEWIDIVVHADSLLFSASVLLMVAIGEELVFRGYVLRNLMKSVNRWLALFLSALFFTLVHASNPGVPVAGLVNTFLGGLLMGLTFLYTRNIWMPVFFHFTWNYLQGPVIGFAVSGIQFQSLLVTDVKGDVLISGGEYGLEGSAIAGALLLITTLIWFYLEKRRPLTETYTDQG